jgi:hypothetical protein
VCPVAPHVAAWPGDLTIALRDQAGVIDGEAL